MNRLAEFVNEKLKEKYIQVGGKPTEIDTPFGVRVTVKLEPDYEGGWDNIASDFGDFSSSQMGDVWCDRKYKCVVTHGDRWPALPFGWIQVWDGDENGFPTVKDVEQEIGLSSDWLDNNGIPWQVGYEGGEADAAALEAFDNWIKRLYQWANAHTIEGDKVITPGCYVRYYDEGRECRYFNLVNSGLDEAEYAAEAWKMAERFNDNCWSYYFPEVKVYVQGQEVFSKWGWSVQMGDWTSKEEQEWVRESVAEVLNQFDAAACSRTLEEWTAIVDELNDEIESLRAVKRQMEADDERDNE